MDGLLPGAAVPEEVQLLLLLLQGRSLLLQRLQLQLPRQPLQLEGQPRRALLKTVTTLSQWQGLVGKTDLGPVLDEAPHGGDVPGLLLRLDLRQPARGQPAQGLVGDGGVGEEGGPEAGAALHHRRVLRSGSFHELEQLSLKDQPARLAGPSRLSSSYPYQRGWDEWDYLGTVQTSSHHVDGDRERRPFSLSEELLGFIRLGSPHRIAEEPGENEPSHETRERGAEGNRRLRAAGCSSAGSGSQARLLPNSLRSSARSKCPSRKRFLSQGTLKRTCSQPFSPSLYSPGFRPHLLFLLILSGLRGRRATGGGLGAGQPGL